MTAFVIDWTGSFSDSSLPILKSPDEILRIFLVVNQSNEDGRGDSALSPAVPAGMGYMWRSGTGIASLLPLADPTSSTTASGSAWPALSNKYSELTDGLRPVFVLCALGGSPQTAAAVVTGGSPLHWDVGGTLRTTALARARNCLAALTEAGIEYEVAGIVGGGGERDAQGIDAGLITAAQYRTALTGMLTYFRTELAVPDLKFVMKRVARDSRGDTTGFQQIRAQQDDVCATVDGFVMGYTGGLAAIDAGRVKNDGFYVHLLQQDLNQMGGDMATALIASGAQ